MVSGLQKRIALRRKLHILRTLTYSKSVKRSCILADAILYIYNLKLKLEEIKRELSNLDDAIKAEFLNLIKQIQVSKRDVKVEKAGKGFVVKVICEGGRDCLVPILEVFEEMGLVVVNAKVSCKFYFAMEAIVVPEEEEEEDLEVKSIAQALLEAIDRHVNKMI